MREVTHSGLNYQSSICTLTITHLPRSETPSWESILATATTSKLQPRTENNMNTTELEEAIAEQRTELEEFSVRLEAVELDQIRQVADAITMLEYLKERSPHGVSDAELGKLIGTNFRTTKATLMVLGLAEIVRAANSGPRAMYILTRYADGTEVSLNKLRDQALYRDLPFPEGS